MLAPLRYLAAPVSTLQKTGTRVPPRGIMRKSLLATFSSEKEDSS